MSPKRNEYDRVVQELRDELSSGAKRAGKAKPVGYGEERLSARDARNRYSQMSRGEIEKLTPAQRKDMVGLLGVDGVIARLRGTGE